MNFLNYPLSNKFRSHTPRGFYDKVKGHTGEDYVCPVGTDIVLPFPVFFYDFLKQKEMGNTLYLKDHYGNILVFAHLSEVLIPKENGLGILAGRVLAKSGNTGGKSTAPHVHFEVIANEPQKDLEFMTRKLGKANGYNIDPSIYMKKMEVRQKKVDSWHSASNMQRVAKAAIVRLRQFIKKS